MTWRNYTTEQHQQAEVLRRRATAIHHRADGIVRLLPEREHEHEKENRRRDARRAALRHQAVDLELQADLMVPIEYTRPEQLSASGSR